MLVHCIAKGISPNTVINQKYMHKCGCQTDGMLHIHPQKKLSPLTAATFKKKKPAIHKK